MSFKIYKHRLIITDTQEVKISGWKCWLKVAEQNGNLCLWYLVDTEEDSFEAFDIYIIGTGNPIDINNINLNLHLDSVVMSSGLVWHVFTKLLNN